MVEHAVRRWQCSLLDILPVLLHNVCLTNGRLTGISDADFVDLGLNVRRERDICVKPPGGVKDNEALCLWRVSRPRDGTK